MRMKPRGSKPPTPPTFFRGKSERFTPAFYSNEIFRYVLPGGILLFTGLVVLQCWATRCLSPVGLCQPRLLLSPY